MCRAVYWYLGISQQAVDQMVGKAVKAEAASGDDGETAGHGFKDWHAPRFIAGGEQEAVMPPVQTWQLLLHKE